MALPDNFYSRPCGRGDLHNVVVQVHDAEISTHAPAGGATAAALKLVLTESISTHAPAGGATGFVGMEA